MKSVNPLLLLSRNGKTTSVELSLKMPSLNIKFISKQQQKKEKNPYGKGQEKFVTMSFKLLLQDILRKKCLNTDFFLVRI